MLLSANIINNIPILEEWCGLKYKEIIYDSFKDGKLGKIFRNKIMNHSHLYFIIIDSHDNVFGHFDSAVIDKIGEDPSNSIYDSNIFMISLNSNGRNGIKKYERRRRNLFTYICNGNDPEIQFYCCGNDESVYDFYGIDKFEDNYGIITNIHNSFKGMNSTDITGNDCNKESGQTFNPKRLIIIEMQESEEQKRIREFILEKEELPPNYDFIFINAAYETSINIRGDVNCMIIHTTDETSRTQARNRYRGDLETQYLLLDKKEKSFLKVPAEFLNIPLDKEKKKELSDFMGFRNNTNHKVGWPTTKKRLIEAGYEIKDIKHRINGKQTSCSIISLKEEA
jgi:hypothetical protein